MLTSFSKRVLDCIKKIPKGKVTTYRLVAKTVGSPWAMRAVGTALRKNPWPVVVPCHRVVKSDGRVGSYTAPGGVRKKKELLQQEGIKIKGDKIVNFKKYLYRF